jgi:hypothetical protein
MMINPMSRERALVITILRQAGKPLRLMEIAAVAHRKPTNVAALLNRMRTDGQADYVVTGHYRRRLAKT